MGAKIVGVSEQGRSIQGLQLPIFEKKPVMNAQEWALLCEGLNRLGRIALEYGITLTYHHHMGTGNSDRRRDRPVDGKHRPGSCGTVVRLGSSGLLRDEDGEAVLRKHIARVRHVHLKDIRPEVIKTVRKGNARASLDRGAHGRFCCAGRRAIHFEPLFRLLDAYGYAGWMIVEAEQDPAIADPLRIRHTRQTLYSGKDRSLRSAGKNRKGEAAMDKLEIFCNGQYIESKTSSTRKVYNPSTERRRCAPTAPPKNWNNACKRQKPPSPHGPTPLL